MENRYSLWIIPFLEVKQILQQTISDLSVKYQTPNFEPHMTLIGDVPGDEKTIIEKAEILVSKIKPFPLTLGEISFSTTYFQSVFVRVKSTAELMNANLKAKEIYHVDNNVFMPHISLIYGDHSMEEAEKIASALTITNNLSFKAEKIVVIPSTQNPDDWQHLVELPFKAN